MACDVVTFLGEGCAVRRISLAGSIALGAAVQHQAVGWNVLGARPSFHRRLNSRAFFHVSYSA